jgi:hypothetical protein
MVKRIPVSAERRDELREDLRKNVPQGMKHALNQYVRWLNRNERPAERLCQTGVRTWIVHAENGDGGLTDTRAPHAPGLPARTPDDHPGEGLLSAELGT